MEEKLFLDKIKNKVDNYNIFYGFSPVLTDRYCKEILNYFSYKDVNEINTMSGIYNINNKIYLGRTFNIVFSYLVKICAFLKYKNVIFLGVDFSRSGYFYNPINNYVDKLKFNDKHFINGTINGSEDRKKQIRNILNNLTKQYGINFYYYDFNYPTYHGNFGIKIPSEKNLLNF